MASSRSFREFCSSATCLVVFAFLLVSIPINAQPPDRPDDGAQVSGFYEIGPIADRDSADQLRDFFESRGVEFQERDESIQQPLDFIVVTPVLAEPADARQQLQDMKDQGLSDLVLLRRDAYKNRISLGIYSARTGAELRQKTVSSLGFEVEVLQRIPTQSARWFSIFVSEDPQGFLEDLVSLVGQQSVIRSSLSTGSIEGAIWGRR